MKRSEALAPLSRDHHQALMVAMLLRRGDEDAEARFADFWAVYGDEHFAIEERLLVAGLLPDDECWSGYVERMRAEHAELRDRATRPPDSELGELLAGHVRFEDREMFPWVEQQLAADALDELGRAVAAAHHETP